MKRFYSIFLTAALLSLSALFNCANATKTTVNSLQQIQNNIANYDTLVVTEQIVLTDGITLNGRKTKDGGVTYYNTVIQVPKPYIDESGLPNTDPSEFGVFRLATGAKVSLSYLTIMGGGIYPMYDSSKTGTVLNIEYYIAAVQNGRRYLSSDGTKEYPEDGGTLYMDHCTVQRSERGMYNYHGQTQMTHCKLIRNTARFGAGALNEDGVLIMDGCSFSENRATRDGGALESKVNARTYLNNTIMANNIGGMSSINNNRGAQCYFMNSTVTGNMSYNNDYSMVNIVSEANYDNPCCYACNSIITNNYRFDAVNGGTTITEKDINNSTGTVNLYNCIYGTNNNTTNTNCYQSTTSSAIFQDNINSSLFYAKYKRADGTIQYAKGGYYFFYAVGHTPAFDHTGLVHNDNGTITAPVTSDGLAATTVGCKTYFNPVIDESNYKNTKVYMGYLDGTTIKDLKTGEAVTDATKYEGHEVIVFANGEARESTIVGSSPATNEKFYSLTLTGDNVHGTCIVDGATFFGDSYKEGKKLHVSVTGISTNYVFEKWTVTKKYPGGDVVSDSTKQNIIITMDANTIIEPTYTVDEEKKGKYNITYDLKGGELFGGATIPSEYTYNGTSQTTVSITDNVQKTVGEVEYTFLGWTGSNGNLPQTGVSFQVNSVGDKHYIARWSPNVYYPTVNQDPRRSHVYYGTFFDELNKYELPAGVEAYTATFNEQKTALITHKLADPGEVIPKNTPVILKVVDRRVTDPISEMEFEIDEQVRTLNVLTLYSRKDAIPVEEIGNDLQGVQDTTKHADLPGDMSEDTYYILSGKSRDGSVVGVGFYKWDGDIPAHKAYTTLWGVPTNPAQASAPKNSVARVPFLVDETEEQTGTSVATDIDQISNEQLQMSNKLLIDGHLYIIRDARVYNAQGQLVK